MHLKMVESESTFAYMEATREYIERHGKPVPSIPISTAFSATPAPAPREAMA